MTNQKPKTRLAELRIEGKHELLRECMLAAFQVVTRPVVINMTVWAANCMTVWFWKVVCMHKVSSTCIVEYTPNITLGHGLIRFGLVSGSTSGEDFMRWKIWRPIHVLLKRPGQMTG